MPKPSVRSALITGGMLLWILLVGAGLWWFNQENFKPGATGSPESRWPADAQLAAAPRHGHTLVLALHPECPCSRATVEELGVLLAATGDRLQARVLMVQYADLHRPAEQSALWKQAAALPGVVLQADLDGLESRRFAIATSGDTRLYDADGRLVFHGGITASRGHSGPNPGVDMIRSLVLATGGDATLSSTPVFGCSL